MKKIKLSVNLTMAKVFSIRVTMHRNDFDSMQKWKAVRVTKGINIIFSENQFQFHDYESFWVFAKEWNYSEHIREVTVHIPARSWSPYLIIGISNPMLRKLHNRNVHVLGNCVIAGHLGANYMDVAFSAIGENHVDHKHACGFYVIDDDIFTKFKLMDYAVEKCKLPGVEPITVEALSPPPEVSADWFHVIHRYWKGTARSDVIINIPRAPEAPPSV